jgi:hypothetical protein
MFVALGNNRPPILVMLEDGVLECIVAICEGNSTQYVLDRLHSQLLLLESDLTKDGNAMQWFNLSTVGASMPPTPPHSHDAEDVVSNDNSENQLEGGVMEREEGEVMEREEGGVTQQEEGEAMEQEEGGMIEREEGEVMEQDVGGTGDEVIRIPRSRTSSMSSLSTVSEDSDQPMADIVPDLEPDQESSVMMEVDREDSRMSVDSSEDSSERGRNLGIGASQIVAPESNQVRLDFIGPNTELRRSSRNTSSKNHPILPLAIPPKSPPRKRKSTQKKHEFLLQVSVLP